MNKLIQTLLISIFMILAVPALAQAQPLLLRTADSSEVYYVNTKLGLKKPMLSERVFKSYNNSWSWVKVVPKSEIDRYSDIRLVKLPDSPAIYYISGVTRQLVPTEQVFIANGFRWNEVVTVNYIDLSSYRLIEPLKALGARTSTKTSTSTPAKITVSAASAPKDDDRTVPADAEFTAHSINLKNTGRSDAHIKGIKLDVLGLDANAQSVGNIFIADANGNKIAGPFKTGVYGVTDIKLGTPITVPAGVNLNLKFITSGNTPGMYIALRVTDISYVETDAAVSAKKFPVTGNYYRIVDEPLVYNHTRAVTVQITPIRREITAGSRNLDVTKILLYEKTGDADVYLNKLTLTIVGEQPDAWVRNLKLVDANNRVVGSVSRVKNGIATFTFKKG
ncbi:MAG: hypothetical protein KBB55_02310, partial [Candidatus Buchananbacteria bacterium]|nr:hypothetical protein [Candidatus Buchananbacteria bacterium]